MFTARVTAGLVSGWCRVRVAGTGILLGYYWGRRNQLIRIIDSRYGVRPALPRQPGLHGLPINWALIQFFN